MPRDGLPQAAQVADDLAGCLPRGYRLNEFVIDRVIAEGGFGVVYSALDLRLKRRVAIKEYMPSLLARRAGDFSVQPRSSVRHQDAFAVGLKSFINEARLLAQFDHPSLVRVHQFWEDKGTGFIVMPLYEGPTLKQWLAANPPPDEAWLRAFLDRMLDALALLHKADCLHRDVAPDNILVLKDSAPLLLDFGAARRVLDELTQSLTVIVKPGYAPIEQYADVPGLKQGPWTDLYALCATAHTIIQRQPPPPAVARTVHDEMTPLSEAAFGRYSHALLAALDAGLAVRPEHRPPSVDVLRALIAAGDRDDAERTVLLPPAAPAQAVAAEAAPTPNAPEAVAPATASGGANKAPVAAPASPHGPAPSAPPLPVAFKRRSRLFELLFERPLTAREAAFAMAVGLIGVGSLALRALEPSVPAVEASRAIEAQIKPIVPAPVVQPPPTPAPEPTAAAPAQSTPADAATLADGDLQPLASATEPLAPRVAPVTVARATKPAAAAPAAAPKRPRADAPSAAAAPAGERSGTQREAPIAARVDAPLPALPCVPAPTAEPPALDRSVATVEAPAAPPPAPNAEPPPRAALVPVAQPRPAFSAEAARDGITEGRVLARLAIGADGRVTGVRILESAPRRVFDREVRHAALRWRYQPPGEPREVDVEFVFRVEG